MPSIRLKQNRKQTTASMWRVIDANTHRCGNVQVVRCRDPKVKFRDDWRIQVRNYLGEWVTTYPAQRPYGYSGSGAAKRGAALMAAWQRGVYASKQKGGDQ